MISKFTCGLTALALTLVLGSSLASASGDDAIKARQACMKANGGAMGVFVPIVKGEKAYDAAAVADALGKMDAACADWAKFWPEDSKTSTTLKTRATDAVWTDAKGFEAAGTAYYTAFTALKATTDEAGFKAAFGDLGKQCGACHEKFRAAQQ
jgi:cytochrome c556